MHLIDVYIQEVTRRLPEKNRQDIALELRSTIEDMLPENYTEVEVKEALGKMGSPVSLASGYLDRPMHLIGPRYFDVYVTLLKMIVPIAATIAFIILIAENMFSYNGEEALINIILTIVGKGIWEILSISIHTFFWITLVFAIIERTDTSKEKLPLTTSLKEWTPDDLNNIPYILKGKEISKSSIFGSLLGIAIFTAIYFNAVQLIGVYEKIQGKLQFVTPTFNQEVLHAYWLIVLIAIGVEVALVCYKFVIGQWTRKVAIMNTLRHVVSSTVFILIFSNTNLINPDFISYLERLFNTSIEIKSSIILGVIFLWIVSVVIDVIQGFRKANISK
ncbi:HAAS signaling domain-containing protein [Psychrobacillus vulpis]|uniref:Uncharacterized protein n=1 Tax=Psychrobacillus vulpis TaxID=2325572 RepID=A0A544TSH5_9BACI|nr:hypothetical protein [Psychrobacillus vulpis]TQR20360.1 hypothetical protein FG384_07925 [Psychrobacillus vulpis]